jgi:hypothetical protein
VCAGVKARGSGSVPEVGEDGEDAAVVVGGLAEVELPEDLADVRVDGSLRDDEPFGDGPSKFRAGEHDDPGAISERLAGADAISCAP